MKKEFRDLLKERGRKGLPKVLLASAECAPLSKTGGLADVVGTLPKSLAKLGIDARVITPYHRCIKDKYASQVQHMFYFYVQLGWRREYVGIEKLELDGMTVYLVDNERYFGDKIYRSEYMEELEQYAFFTRAVLDAIPNLDFKPEIAKELGLEAVETDFTRHDVYTADECFLTGSAAELIPVVAVDAREIGDGKPGPITARILSAFGEFVKNDDN